MTTLHHTPSQPAAPRWDARYHHTSIFGAGDRQALTPAQIGLWKWRARSVAGARRLTRAGLDVAEALASYLGPDGRLDPSYEALADRCRQRGGPVARRTVARQLAALRECGLITWERRIVRHGRHIRQTSNAYRLRFPPTVAQLVPKPLRHREPTSSASVALGPSASIPDRAAAMVVLDRIARERPVPATGNPVRRNRFGFRVYGREQPA